ncbi:bifunctional helix-turn-helix transcriptional regulator/GNAT family N-acetyltransferase [Luteimonas salinilitoris]|uniref:GNAT family N-acetyltransferase n=1 Tax=Luteimonas salinilitoris TaxID=3237697 RepID=A0ABV4HT83_9GAMM
MSLDPTTAQIAAVRGFNRYYTQRIGVLQERLLDSPHSLTEVRLLYELAHRPGASAFELATDLGLDRGYLSRMLKRFESRGLIARTKSTTDGRRHHLRLMPAGRRTFALLDRRSAGQVATLLGALDPDRREGVLAAMRTIHDSLEGITSASAEVVLRSHRPGDIGWVVQRHGELYCREYGWDERFETLVADIAVRFVRKFDPRRERCWIAERDGERLGCVFLVAENRAEARLRMLLVEPHARGLGLGRRLVGECVHFAHAAGYRRIVLWTQSNLHAARHLYAEAGFRKTAETPHDDFGEGLIAETWTLDLATP